MKKFIICWLFLSLLNINLFAQENPNGKVKTISERKEIGNLVLEGIPEINKNIFERTAQYQNVRSAGFVAWHPNGKGMLVSTRFAETSQLHYVGAPSSYRKQLTFFREPINGASYSPDKEKKGFVFSMDTGGGEFFQFYWYDENTGKHTLLTDGKSRYESFVWSNKGDKGAFVSTKRNGRDFDVYLMEGADLKTTKLIKETNGQWNVIDWSNDDKKILLRNFISANESYLFILDVATSQLTEINPTQKTKKISYGDSLFSADGKGLYYTSDEGGEFLQLTYYDLATGKKQTLLPNLNWDVENIELSKDGQLLAYTVNEAGISKLYIAPANNLNASQNVVLEKGVIGGLKFDEDASKLAISLSSSKTPGDVFSLDVKTGTATRWTFSEVGGLNPENFVDPELIEFPSFDTVGTKPRMIPSFYYKPKNAQEKLPVIINIHGGPEGQSRPTFSSTYAYWVNELGAAVLVPNVRGSSGYGKTYLELDNGFKREDSVKDIGKLLDWIATRPELDASRVAVIGGSYGGYMSLASMTNFNDRLKCAVDIVGISNFVTFLESTQEYRRDLRRPEYGDERDPKMREFLLKISPTTNASKITKPLFVVQGKNDPRVPLSEAEQMVSTIKNNGSVVWYLLAKDEGHGFRKKPNQEFYLGALSVFFEQHLLK
jgi:dipeptidyl aminopeptidase/acylaminoacyl peptidase